MAQRDLVDEVLQAIDIVAKEHLKDLAYDVSKSCTIVDASDSKNGHYIVTDGSIRFDAYSTDATYKKDDAVLVSIPNGDFSQRKYIISKEVTDNNSAPITYISKLDTILDMTGNMEDELKDSSGNYNYTTNPSIDGTWSFKANGKGFGIEHTEEIDIWSVDMSNSKYKDLQNNGLYDTIAIKAEFKTLLSHYKMKSGNYGLKLVAQIAEVGESTPTSTKTMYLDSSQMYGNPYSFSVYSTQESKIDISQLGNVRHLKLSLYQKGNFSYIKQDGTVAELPVTPNDNIFVRNIYVSFGNELTKVEDNSLKFYTPHPLEYHRGASDIDRTLTMIWYNKDEYGRYLGYSDGLVDDTYDELDYLEKSAYEAKLKAQEGKEIPLDEPGMLLSGDIDEIGPAISNLATAITRDLKSQVQAFGRKISLLMPDEDDNKLRQLYDALTKVEEGGAIYDASASLPDDRTTLVNFYREALKQAHLRFEKKEAYTSIDSKGKTTAEAIKATYETVDKAIDDFLTEAEKVVNDNKGFLSIYNAYSKRIKDTQEKIDDLYEVYKNIVFRDTPSGNPYNVYYLYKYFDETYSYNKREVEDLSKYDNRYCIYLYRYDATLDPVDDGIMPVGWHRMAEHDNFALPAEDKENKPGYHKVKLENGAALTVTLDTAKITEKFVVVLYYNHTRYKSDELVFTNQNPPKDEALMALTNAVLIEHKDNSRESYQVYDVNNQLVNMADASKKRKLMARFLDPLDPVLDDYSDGFLAGAQIFWYVPNNATMLKVNPKDIEGKFTTDEEDSVHSANYREGFTCYYRDIAAAAEPDAESLDENADIVSEDRYFTYGIKDYYVPAHTNNTIYCVVKKDDFTYEGEIAFKFSSYGTSGTDYTLTVAPAGLRIAIGPEKGIDLMASLYDYNNAEKDILATNDNSANAAYFESLERLGPAVASGTPGLPDNTTCDFSGNAVSFTLEPGMLNYEKYDTEGNTIAGSHFYNVIKANVVLAQREDTETDETSEDYKTKKMKNITLSAIYPISYSSGAEGEYYIEGATHVIYDASGANPSYYRGAYNLFQFNQETGEEIHIVTDEEKGIEVTWSIEHLYCLDGKLTTDTSQHSLLRAYAPTLDSENKLVPAVMYLDGIDSANGAAIYSVVKCFVNGVLKWAQPIYIGQNRYPSPMLNSWDGSLTIDEKNGTILSSMVGAGRKNTNNQFEGVLMGDVLGSAEDDASGIGLFGYNEGAQSFALKIDGTAFFGKSGRGRIEIDGNKGTISSASWEQYKIAQGKDENGNYKQFTSGMLIDLDDGQIEMRGATQDGNKYLPETNSYVRISTMSPYFQIDSSTQHEDGTKTLLFIGKSFPRKRDSNGDVILDANGNEAIDTSNTDYDASTQGFYLQSDNYAQDLNGKGIEGMRIDLERGHIDAHNFNLTTSYLEMNSLGTRIHPYLSIKSNKEGENKKELFHLSEDGFLIRSADDVFTVSSGMDSLPYLRVQVTTQKADGTSTAKSLLEVTNTTFVMRSKDFEYIENNLPASAGMELDIWNGQITAYDGLTIKAYTDDERYLILDTKVNLSTESEDKTFVTGRPLQIGKKFWVDWEGNMSATDGTFSNINITSGSIKIGSTKNYADGHAGYAFEVTSAGNLYAQSAYIQGTTTIGGTTNIGGTTTIADTLNVTGSANISGTITAADGEIGGWKVGSGEADGFRSGTLIMSPSSGLNYNENFTVDEDGNLTAVSATFIEKLIVKASKGGSTVLDVDSSGNTSIKGKLSIGTKVKPADLEVFGEATISANLEMKSGKMINCGDEGVNLKFYDNGLFVSGNLFSVETSFVQVIKGCTWSFLDNSIVKFYGGTTVTMSTCTVDISGTLTIPEATTITDGTNSWTIPEYVNAKGGFTLIDLGGDKSGTIATGALGLYNGNIKTVDAPATAGSTGQVLTKTDSGTAWSYIKKKFNVTMSGDATVDMSNYYTTTGLGYGYHSGSTLYIYTPENSTEIKWGTSLPTGATKKDSYTLRGNYMGYVYSRSAADDKTVTVTLKGTSGEITLDGGNDTDGSIDILITGATAS